MHEPEGWKLSGRVWLISAVIGTVAGLAAWLVGARAVLWGYLGGVVIGGLLFTGVVVLVCVLIAPSPEAPYTKRQKAAALALQGVKYAVVIGGLYLLVVHWEVNGLAVFLGLATPILIAVGVVLLRPGGRYQVFGRRA